MALYHDSPQDLGRTLDNGFAIYRASLKPVLALSFATALLVSLPSLVTYAGIAAGVELSGPWNALDIIGSLLYFVMPVGLIFAQDAIARGQAAPSTGEALGHLGKRAGVAIAAGILYLLAMALGLIALVIPGVILSVSLGLCTYLVATESVGPTESLSRSHKLVWGQWWRTLVVITVAVILYFIPLLLVGGVAGFVVAMIGGVSNVTDIEEHAAGFVLAMAVLEILGAALLMPLMNGILLAQLNDLKLRKSGADLLARAPA
ncbi:MAG TPA: hypothetical protein VJM11_15860 [Nevskiaceae bacterium]|nr:hypothetical protein [Nevskiaceae bacterium]